MTTVGIPDFHMNDVYRPEYKRTIRNLSAVINFIKFKGERLRKFEDYNSEEVSSDRASVNSFFPSEKNSMLSYCKLPHTYSPCTW